MINSLVTFLEGLDPLLVLFNSHSVFIYGLLFLSFFVKTKNYLALVIIGESILGYLANNYLTEIHILAITAQFIIYCMALYLTKKTPLIFLAYLILIAHFLIQYITNSIHLVHNTWTTYNIAALVYYSFYVLLPFILYLMIKGLFAKWGKGYGRGRLYNSYNWLNGDNHYLLGCNIHRFKRLFKVSNKRA